MGADALGTRLAFTFTVFSGAPQLPIPFGFPYDDAAAASQEPVAIAGGPIFVPVQLIEKLDSEAELAAVLAHAIAHTSLRHATRLATREELAGLAGQPGMPVITASAASRKFARSFELEADNAAARMLAAAGYDPAALVIYLRKLPPVGNPAFSSLPDPSARVQAVQPVIAAVGPGERREESGGFAQWKQAVLSAQ